MRILIADDDFVSRSLLNVILNVYGDVDVAVSSEEAITAYKAAHVKNNPYKLVFLDRIMPGKRGDEVLKVIRQYEADRNIDPKEKAVVIMSTAVDDPREVFEAFANQCEGYLIKPIDKEKLLQVVRESGIDLERYER